MVVTTSRCRAFDHPEFDLEAADSRVPAVYVEQVADMLENMVAAGSTFHVGEFVQIGWMTTKVEVARGGCLALAEPDMKSFPIRWVRGVTETSRTLMLQMFVLDSVSLRAEMQTPSIRQSLIACTRYAAPAILMNRSVSRDPDDSGWFVGCRDDDHDHDDPASLRRISIYEAYLRQPRLQAFVALPAGVLVVLGEDDGPKIIRDEELLQIRPGSFLEVARREGPPDREPDL